MPGLIRQLAIAPLLAGTLLAAGPAQAQARAQKPNILVITGDDVGWENLGSYHQGLMLDATPNLDKLASKGKRSTDYYAEASCMAGRANFITGELPLRTGLTTVGQAGSALGMHDQAPTIADTLNALGYATGQHVGRGAQRPMTAVRADNSTSRRVHCL